MAKTVIKGKGVGKGIAEGTAIISTNNVSFYFDVDLLTGVVQDPTSNISGQSIAGKVLIFPSGRGPSGGQLGLYLLKKDGHHPKAIIVIDPEETVVAGAVMTDIPMIYHLDQDPLKVITTGDTVTVDADKGLVEIVKN